MSKTTDWLAGRWDTRHLRPAGMPLQDWLAFPDPPPSDDMRDDPPPCWWGTAEEGENHVPPTNQ